MPDITSLSPFHIPHVLDMICNSLDVKDLIHCLQVSPLWYGLFLPQAKRHIRIYCDLTTTDATATLLQALEGLENAGQIKTLLIDIDSDTARVGQFLHSAFTCPSLPSPSSIQRNTFFLEHPVDLKRSEGALSLVEKCPKLQVLRVLHHRHVQPYTATTTFASPPSYKANTSFNPYILQPSPLSAHTSLTQIAIYLPHISLPKGFLTSLLQSLPRSLLDLEVRVKSWLPSSYTATATAVESLLTPKSPPSSSSNCSVNDATTTKGRMMMPSVRGLCLTTTNHGHSWENQLNSTEDRRTTYAKYVDSCSLGWSFLPLLNTSTRLQDLTLHGYTGNHIHSLLQALLDTSARDTLESLDLGFENGYTRHPLPETARLQATFSRLRIFRLRGTLTSLSEVVQQQVPDLIARSKETIEVVDVDLWIQKSWWRTENPSHMGPVWKWKEWTNLKEFSVRMGEVDLSDGSVEEEDVGYASRSRFKSLGWSGHSDTVVALEDLVREPWKCAVVEVLRLHVRDDSFEGCREAGMVEEYQSSGIEARSIKTHCTPTIEEQKGGCCRLLGEPSWNAAQIHNHQQYQHRLQFASRIHQLHKVLRSMRRLKTLELRWSLCPTFQRLTMDELLDLISEAKGGEAEGKGKDGEETIVVARTISREDLEWLALPFRPE